MSPLYKLSSLQSDLRCLRTKSSVTTTFTRPPTDPSLFSINPVVRVRPIPAPTDPGFDSIPQRFQTPVVQVQSTSTLSVDSVMPQNGIVGLPSTPGNSSSSRKLFVFDRVFEPNVSQEGVWDYLSESVNHFIDGYNVSMLAYGQSGSGKSYTMGTTGKHEQENGERMGTYLPALCFCNRAIAHILSSTCSLHRYPTQELYPEPPGPSLRD